MLLTADNGPSDRTRPAAARLSRTLIVASFVVALLVSGPLVAGAQELSVAYRDGLLTVHCTNAPLADLLDQVEERTGIDVAVKITAAARETPAGASAAPVS